MTDAKSVLEALRIRLGEIESEEAALLDIERARVTLLCYCNIPLTAQMPQGLFEAWCIAAEEQLSGVSGGIASISEGDVSISFGKNGASDKGQGQYDWKTTANRFRQLAV